MSYSFRRCTAGGKRRRDARTSTDRVAALARTSISTAAIGTGVFVCIFVVCALFLRPVDAAARKVDLTISAAISLQNALQEVATLYHTGHPDVQVHLNLGASGTLQRQIEQGAPVDLFLSAAESEMDGLESKGFVLRDTRKNLLTNSVVLIVPKGSNGIRHFQDLTQAAVKIIAIGNPESVPAGKYAEQVLTHFGLYDTLRPKFVFAKDVRAVLTYVETGNADAGIVYETDALTSSQVTVIATAPPGSHAPVVYPVAVIAASRNVEAAKEFESFLFGPESAAVFRKYGFRPAAH